ncbi:MAG: sulfide/dihydroorotate dehydrogenase-like FAD/NAD-binding protein [Acidobacteriota bacterium]|nr:sulfide/dihydroorotate dehydrogenase-like FAD/NAD-binding protein [Acidobacteriota bacterium]
MREYEILSTEDVTEEIKIFDLYAPMVSRRCQPGQFLIVMNDERGERIPLTIADFDREKGTVEIVFQVVGKSTAQLGAMKPGDALYAVVGPFGHPSEIRGHRKVVTVGGGIGIAPVYPIARGYRENGAYTINIIGARHGDLLVYEEKMRAISDELIVCTDDGSRGRKALVTEPLKEILEAHDDVDLCLAIGPPIMMKFVAETTRPLGVKTIVSLNSVMIDGTGMCGGCRVDVGGKTFFTCVDGPEFDGHAVDFDLLMSRQSMYRDQERQAMERWEHECRLGLQPGGEN